MTQPAPPPGYYPHPQTGVAAYWNGQAWAAASVAPGWFPDGSGALRWWDGSSWTTHTASAVGVGAATALPTYADVRGGGAARHALWAVPLSLVAVIALIASTGGGGGRGFGGGSSGQLSLTVIDYYQIESGCDPDTAEEADLLHCVMQMSGVEYDLVMENTSGEAVEVDRNDITLVDLDGNEYRVTSPDPSNADVVFLNPGETGDFTLYFPGAPASDDIAELRLGEQSVPQEDFVPPAESEYAPSLS